MMGDIYQPSLMIPGVTGHGDQAIFIEHMELFLTKYSELRGGNTSHGVLACVHEHSQSRFCPVGERA